MTTNTLARTVYARTYAALCLLLVGQVIAEERRRGRRG